MRSVSRMAEWDSQHQARNLASLQGIEPPPPKTRVNELFHGICGFAIYEVNRRWVAWGVRGCSGVLECRMNFYVRWELKADNSEGDNLCDLGWANKIWGGKAERYMPSAEPNQLTGKILQASVGVCSPFHRIL